MGYSYGSVLEAHVALALSQKGYKVDNLALVGSPISSNSDLYKALGKITHIIRVDIKDDKLSNAGTLQYLSGVRKIIQQANPLRQFRLIIVKMRH